ncbi:MAG: serine/threonine-protein kinase, partial [Kiritimatiellia bacterium]|nr:serine/threonine-protein kinase [Kiritimatiellia bacterium]
MTAKKADDLILSLAERVNKLACSQCGEVLQVADLEMLSETVCPSCQTRQPVPAKLKKFLLLEVLGTGGMASVYRAYDQSLGRMVAIKVMRREMGEDPTFVENFLREARSAAQLNHRNVVSIFTVDEVRGQPFIVMELLDGGRLDEMITQGQPIPEKRVLEIAHDVAEGLQAASQIGLIHGDVKPANILFNRAGQAKVADFGIARFQARKLSKGEIWGTPYYIAPEKVQGNKEDLRSDIYSLGGTLFHALSLLPPYDGPTATDVVLARLQRPPPNLNDLRSDLHPETVALISRMLEQDPFRRYPNYASLMSDLDAAMTAVARDPLPSSVHKKHPTPEGSGSRFPKWAYFAAGAAGLVAIGAALLILRKSPPPPQEPSVEPPAAVVEPTPAPTPTTEPDPAPTPMLPLQPFSVEDQKFLVEVGALLAEGKTENSDTKLLEFARATRDHPGRVWIPVFMALPVWMDLDSTQTVSRLKRLVEFAYEPQADGSVHPGLLAQAFGRVMIGASETLPPPAEGQAWPGWATDLFQFFEAVQGLRKGEPMPKVSEKLGVYLDAAASEEIAWPYALQPLARNWK